MRSPLPITACLVIYNEEDIVARALESIHGLVDEILVVHDGPCTDSSLEICRHYGAQVYERGHVGIAEPHRAWMYEISKHTWILQIDADEFLSHGLQEALPSLISNDTIACYELEWPNWDGMKYTTHHWPHKKALFRKDRIQFLAFPQAEVIPVGESQKVPYVLEHQPMYDNLAFSTFRTKWMKWVRVHASYLLRDPQSFERYPHHAQIRLPRYYGVVRHPYLLAVPLAAYQGIQALKSGGYKAGWRGVKASVYIALYYLFMALEVAHLESL